MMAEKEDEHKRVTVNKPLNQQFFVTCWHHPKTSHARQQYKTMWTAVACTVGTIRGWTIL